MNHWSSQWLILKRNEPLGSPMNHWDSQWRSSGSTTYSVYAEGFPGRDGVPGKKNITRVEIDRPWGKTQHANQKVRHREKYL